jgi:hypothetical protein
MAETTGFGGSPTDGEHPHKTSGARNGSNAPPRDRMDGIGFSFAC